MVHELQLILKGLPVHSSMLSAITSLVVDSSWAWAGRGDGEASFEVQSRDPYSLLPGPGRLWLGRLACLCPGGAEDLVHMLLPHPHTAGVNNPQGRNSFKINSIFSASFSSSFNTSHGFKMIMAVTSCTLKGLFFQ